MAGLLAYAALGAVKGGADAAGRGWREQAKEARDQAFQKELAERKETHEINLQNARFEHETGLENSRQEFEMQQNNIQALNEMEKTGFLAKENTKLARLQADLTRGNKPTVGVVGRNKDGQEYLMQPGPDGTYPDKVVATVEYYTDKDGSRRIVGWNNKGGEGLLSDKWLMQQAYTRGGKKFDAWEKDLREKLKTDLDSGDITPARYDTEIKDIEKQRTSMQQYFIQKELTAHLGGMTGMADAGGSGAYMYDDPDAFYEKITGNKPDKNPEIKDNLPTHTFGVVVPLENIPEKFRDFVGRIRKGEPVAWKELNEAEKSGSVPPKDIADGRAKLLNQSYSLSISPFGGLVNVDEETEEQKMQKIVKRYLAGEDISYEELEGIIPYLPFDKRETALGILSWMKPSTSTEKQKQAQK